MKLFSLPAVSLLAASVLGASAQANSIRPGSLLVYPIFDNTQNSTIVTVVNTNDDQTVINQGTGQLAGTVKVEFVYINKVNCQEFNRTRTLTPNDEFTIATHLDNPGMQEGFLYVFAKHFTTGKAIKFDWLIGTEWDFDAGVGGAFETGPYVYKAGSRIAPGGNTDIDNDNVRDLNGSEYEQSPDQLLVPRFFGQTPGLGGIKSDLVLINLTGGSQFDAIVDFLIYNDNEEVFSAQFQFRCWVRVPLSTINGVFLNDFLLTTGHALGETTGITVGGVPVETGWYRIDGSVAFSTAASFQDPTILALQIEAVGDFGHGANLPFSTGSQNNGDLLLHSILGDNN